MKNKLILTPLFILIISTIVAGQVTEAEKKIRTVSKDTLLGWNKGGVIAINLAQTSP